MNPVADQISSLRRSPSMGVSGVTLLMLVTLVLTTSPALGRARQLVPVDQGRSSPVAERVAPTPRAEQRLGGKRELSNRQVRPIGWGGGGIALASASADPAPLAPKRPAPPVSDAQAPLASERVPAWLLNTPPPRM